MKVVIQDGITDCGICCLLSIIRHYGGNYGKEGLRTLTNTTKNGVTAYNLIKCAKQIGFNAYAVSGDIEYIKRGELPVIAHIAINKSYKHFVVIYDIDFSKKRVLIMDPAKGKRIISLSEFKLLSTNNYIYLKPYKKLPTINEQNIIKRTIYEYIKNKKTYMFILIILTIIYFFLNILSAYHFKYLLDFAIEYNISNNIFLISKVILIIYIFKNVSLYLRNIILLKYSEVFDEVITTKTYRQIILLPYLYYKNRTTGEVISRIKDLSVIKSFIISIITTVSTDIVCIVIFIVFLFNISKDLAVISLVYLIILSLITTIFKSLLKKSYHNYYEKEEKLNSYLYESISTVDAIKGIHIEKMIIDRFIIKYRAYLESVYSLGLKENTNNLLQNTMYDIFIVIILSMGSNLIINNHLTIGEFIIFQSIFNFYITSFKSIIKILNDYPKYKISLERIKELFVIRGETFIGSNNFNNKFIGNIEYHNLSYSYNSKPLFKNICLKIKSKDKVFLYGPSGTGKSTLVKLLMRYIDTPYGNISIDNIDINHIHMDILRKNITYVSQQEILYNDTVYNNIVLNRSIDYRDLKKVLKIVKLNKINTNKMVEENGFNFSGGERQRIVIARSILKESSIYIFDEAFSQIDINRERDILKGIFTYLEDKTIIVISHRFSNKDLFNRIIKLEQGNLYEEKL